MMSVTKIQKISLNIFFCCRYISQTFFIALPPHVASLDWKKKKFIKNSINKNHIFFILYDQFSKSCKFTQKSD